MTRDFQKCGILTSVDSLEPVQPPFKLRNLEHCSVSGFTLRIFKPLAKALISLHVCAGWSEPLLVAHTTSLEITCHGSNKPAHGIVVLITYTTCDSSIESTHSHSLIRTLIPPSQRRDLDLGSSQNSDFMPH